MIALGAGDGSAATAKKCSRIKGRVVASNPQMRIVLRRLDEIESELVGCAYRVGRVRVLGSIVDGETSTSTAKLVRKAGTFAAVRTASGSQYGGGESLTVIDVASGHSYRIYSWGEAFGSSSPYVRPTVGTLFLDRQGRTLAALVTTTYGPTGPTGAVLEIVASDKRGKRVVLDTAAPGEIPESSLLLRDGVAVWTHNGERRSAPVSA